MPLPLPPGPPAAGPTPVPGAPPPSWPRLTPAPGGPPPGPATPHPGVTPRRISLAPTEMGTTPGVGGGGPGSATIRLGSIQAGMSIGRYVVEAEIGRGGMGVIYRAHDPVLCRRVAIKMILDGLHAAPQRLERFRREATAAARLRHPGIVAVHEVGDEEGRPFLVMDLVDGEGLDAWLKKRRPGPREVARVMADVAHALGHAHEHGVLHRDVKPDNILVDGEGNPRITDFGLAREVGAADGALTTTGQVLGTPLFMAPEQASGGEQRHGPFTDVWAIGAVLYRALAGRPPFKADTFVDLARKVMEEDPPRLRQIAPAVPRDLETIVLHCLEKDPARRYGNAGELAEELDRFLASEPIDARPRGTVQRGLRWARRHRALAAAIAVGAVGLVALVAVASAAAVRAAAGAREELVAEARADADRAVVAFEQALAGGGGGEGAPRDDDALLGLGLDALEATGRLRALAPRDADAARRRFEVAMELGEAARARGRWGVAASAFRQAEGLGVADDRARAALADLAAERTAAQTRRREAVAAVLDEARTGKVRARGDAGRQRAVFALVRNGGEETALELVAELDRITADLDAVRREMLLGAASTPAHARHGKNCLEGLREAVDARLALAPGAELGPADAAVLDLARRHVELAERDRRLDRRAASFDNLLAGEQERRIGADRLLLARVCCEALGWMPEVGGERVVGALGRHLLAEQSQVRAVAPAVALCLLDGEPARRLVLAAGTRFGLTGPFWKQVSRYLDSDVPLPEAPSSAPAATGDPAAGPRPAPTEPEATTAAASPPPVEGVTDDPIKRALIKKSVGDLDGALAELDRAVAEQPGSVEAWGNRGVVHFDRRELAAAEADLTRAIELDPDNAGCYGNRALVRIDAGDGEGALADARAAVGFDPDNGEVLTAYSRVLTKLGRREEALSALDLAIARMPERPMIWIERAYVKRLLGRLEAALADASRAIELDARNPMAYFERGHVYRTAGQKQLAMADFGRTVELSPRMSNAWMWRGSMKRDLDDPRGAIADHTRAVELDPKNATAWGNRGNARFDLEQLDLAVADWRRSLALDPNQANVHSALGAVLMKLGKLEDAIAYLDRGIELDPDGADGYLNRAIAREELGNLAGAADDFEMILRVEPAHPQADALRRKVAQLRAGVGGGG